DNMTKKLIVKYKAKKISADLIRQVIAYRGYDADNLSADENAYKVLPKTCKAPVLEVSVN
ncbi:MAG: hypothetical protein AAGI07_01885, partial [Bacteroidota bacterium]